jgi:hypothetical protein
MRMVEAEALMLFYDKACDTNPNLEEADVDYEACEAEGSPIAFRFKITHQGNQQYFPNVGSALVALAKLITTVDIQSDAEQ